MLLLALVAAIGLALLAIDTAPGHRFIADRIGELAPRTGLKIRMGRIDGSIWGATRLRDVRLYDPQGLFLEVPELDLDWQPTAWVSNQLSIDRLAAELVVLHRLPKLRSTGEDRPILPGFDIRIGALEIDRLRIEPGVAGPERRTVRLRGNADSRDGRALVRLNARSSVGDRLALLLDVEPDRDRFDVDATLTGPAGGVAGGLIGTARPIALKVAGDGRWREWAGAARLDMGADRIADLALTARAGRYGLSGMLAPAPILQGKLQRLSRPRIAVTGEATLAERRLTGRIALRSAAVALDANGTIDLADSAYEDVAITGTLIQPAALFPNMTGTGIALKATLAGPFATADYSYALAARRFAFDATGFENARATGKGKLSPAPVKLPIRFVARRVTGVGDVAGGILGNLTVDGVLAITAKTLTGAGLRLDSDKLKGKLAVFLDLATGRYDITLSGGLTRYLIPGLGIVDVTSELSVVPDPSGRGTRVEGRGRAWVRRFDNAFLASLAGGLPAIDTRLVRGPDGVLRFSGLRLTAPGIAITGDGARRRDGTFLFNGQGRQSQYGAFEIALDGNISRPKIDLKLPAPQDALGLADVTLALLPTLQGFDYRAAGGSRLGPFTSNGQILLPTGAAATIAVAALDVAGTRGTGALRSDPGGFTGRLAFAGGGIGGTLDFAPLGEIQRIEAHLTGERATIPGATPIVLRRGRVDGVLLIDPAGVSIEGSMQASGARRGGVSIARVAASASLRGGRGTVLGSIAGSRGRAFDLKASASVSPERIVIAGEGTVDRRPIRLTAPAVLTAEGDAWRLSGAKLVFDGGGATLAGRFGADATALEAGLDRLPLSVLDIFYPELGVGGIASGTVRYAKAADSNPSGRADVTVRGLTRSGLVLSSRPVDVGIAAVLNGTGAAARAVVASGGRTIGRAQARIAPLPAGPDLATRLAAAPLFAQLRYTGPADTLWRLTGIETIDLSGPVAIGADVGGSLSDPTIRGSLRTTGARLESGVSGTVIENIAAAGRFGGSRLVIDSFTGTTRGEGRVTGRAAFDLAGARGFGMDIALQAENAVLLDRDDIGATVTGPLTLRSDGVGGTIAGDVQLTRSRFRLGRAEAAAAVPRLPVREINRASDDADEPVAPASWRLDLKARARNRLAVSGLGLDSEWRADLDIKGTVENPAIAGRADLLRGNYEFAGRRFDLERGALRFLGEAPADPVLDIVAQANIQGLNATIRVSGTGQRPDIDFSSIPALPEDELLSRLLFGTSITNLSAPEALQLAAAVASLQGGGTGLNPINAVRRAVGLDRLRILPADIQTGQGTSVAAGKYLGRRTYVEVITDGQGYSATRLEFQVTRWLSLLSSISTIGRTSANVRVSRDY